MIGFLLLYEKGKIKDKNELLDYLIDFYDSLGHSFAKFYSIFMKRCSNIPNVCEIMISFHLDNLKNAPSDKDLSIMKITQEPFILNKGYWKIFNESLDELHKTDSLRYNIFLHNLMLSIEETQESKCIDFENFEKTRFLRRSSIAATLEGYCGKCNQHMHVLVDILDYINSYVYSDGNNRNNHMNVKCLNPNCKGAPIYFEQINMPTVSIKDPLSKKEKKEKIYLYLYEKDINIYRTIFYDSERSLKYQVILKYLYDNPNKFFTKTELINNTTNIASEIFGTNDRKSSGTLTNSYYYQFTSYLDIFKVCNLVITQKVKSSKIEQLLVDTYQLSNLGKTFALISKWKSNDENIDEVYDKIYQHWSLILDQPQASSLHKFCKKYFYECKENGLFDIILNAFDRYQNNHYHVYNDIGNFTYLILPEFDDIDEDDEEENRFRNRKLREIWLKSFYSLDERDEDLLLNHIGIYLARRITKKIHNLDKYEVERFKQKNKFNFVTIEAPCRYCPNEYIYLTIPVMEYVIYLFNSQLDEISRFLVEQSRVITEDYRCNKCEECNLRFLIV